MGKPVLRSPANRNSTFIQWLSIKCKSGLKDAEGLSEHASFSGLSSWMRYPGIHKSYEFIMRGPAGQPWLGQHFKLYDTLSSGIDK